MRILIILYYYHPYVSGLSLLAKMQAEGLASRGHEVTVLTTRHENTLATGEVLNGVNIVRAKVLKKIGKGIVSWNFLKQIADLSKTHDIVNPHLPMAHFGLAVPFIDKRKIVAQYHCDLNLGEGLLAGLLQKFSYWSMNRTLQNSRKIIATTSDYFSCCHFAKYISRVFEIYPPIDQKIFVRKASDDMRKKLAIDNSLHLIGFVGRIVQEKGLEYLLRAIPFLEKKMANFMILIAGDYTDVAGGSVKMKIDRLANEYPGRVKFAGKLKFEELIMFYNMIDVLVLPSVDPLEAFGMVQVEAMLCGTPVVASDMPGVRRVIERTGYGKLVKPRDPQDIADKIMDLINRPVDISREKLVEFDADTSISSYEKVFSEVYEQLR